MDSKTLKDTFQEARDLFALSADLRYRIQLTLKDCDEKTGTMRADLKNGNCVSGFATNENILI